MMLDSHCEKMKWGAEVQRQFGIESNGRQLYPHSCQLDISLMICFKKVVLAVVLPFKTYDNIFV